MAEICPPTGNAPHLRSRETSAGLFWKRCAALAFPAAAALFFYGTAALLILACSAAAALLTERVTGFFLKTAAPFQGSHALLSGLTLALMLPPGIPAWMAALGVVFAVVFARDAFGGTGHTAVPPVLAGYLFLWVSFPLAMRQALEPGSLEAAAFPLAWVKEGAAGLPGFPELLTGSHSGALGTVFFPALLAAGIFLILQRLIAWEIPFLFLGASALTAFGFGEDPLWVLAAGFAGFAAFFLVPETLTAPHHRHGARFFALLAGFLGTALRHVTDAFDPVPAAVMLVSFLSPWLEETGRPEPRLAGKGVA